MNCELCPIRDECEITKENIINNCVADMRTFMYSVMEYCPLIEYMMDSLEASSEKLLNPESLR